MAHIPKSDIIDQGIFFVISHWEGPFLVCISPGRIETFVAFHTSRPSFPAVNLTVSRDGAVKKYCGPSRFFGILDIAYDAYLGK